MTHALVSGSERTCPLKSKVGKAVCACWRLRDIGVIALPWKLHYGRTAQCTGVCSYGGLLEDNSLPVTQGPWLG